MTIYICNAFSLSMLDRESQLGTPRGYTPHTGERGHDARIPRPVKDPADWLEQRDFTSAVGHTDVAAIFSTILGRPIPMNRETVKLGPGDFALVGQYIGPRLPEGATQLPPNATIEWWTV